MGRNLHNYITEIMAGKPPAGLHLDVMKGDKLVEKLIIDEKKYYLFGRNPDMCDFTIDHQSCSRVHAALVYHRHLKRLFLIDLNSTHGTFLGHIRLEPNKPQQVPIDSTVSFGASTRVYTIREKPQTQTGGGVTDGKIGDEEELKGLLGLPQEETELEVNDDYCAFVNLTEFNTAHNKRISTLTIEEGNLDIPRPKRKRKSSRVSFTEEDEIINPEDVDPSKKKVSAGSAFGVEEEGASRVIPSFPMHTGLYKDLPPSIHDSPASAAILGGLSVPLPNPAPDVHMSHLGQSTPLVLNPSPMIGPFAPEVLNEPRKKKYMKEAWPGKKPAPSLLL
ncbi:hypothetical protein DNTS_001123 [Danionella cerebrum]|uniref:Nuclear inhibitor of protein phosphatase 1 n=1 Tax=Danionella cerebrum TaxID=2873325 RepID=A0A553QUM8_9TELE|nr:hypothetical protein DNTS_001123 [Danionella translucida]